MNQNIEHEYEHMKAENAKLLGHVASLSDELKEVRAEARDRRHEVKGLAARIAELTADREGWKAKAEADPEGLKVRVAELTGKLRGLTHRQAFDRIAAGLKVTDPTRQADLYALSGYTPESDDVDESKLIETVQGVLQGRPWFLDAEPGGSTTAPGGAIPGASTTTTPSAGNSGKPGPGADRGQSLSSSTSLPDKKVSGRL
jgi:hypothetical protein